MKNIILVFLLSFPVYAFCQIYDGKSVADSTMIIGFVKEDYSGVGKSINQFCMTDSTIYLKKGVVVLITGTYSCSTNYGSEKKFYKAAYNGNILYFKIDDLITEADFEEVAKIQGELAFNLEKSAKRTTLYRRKVELENALAKYKKISATGLVINNFRVYDESEYTNGTGVEIDFTNTSKKTIKYVFMSFVGYNAVNDAVSSRGVVTIVRKGIGPIKPQEDGSYKFEYAWFTDLVETAKITSLKVQYMDGTMKV